MVISRLRQIFFLFAITIAIAIAAMGSTQALAALQAHVDRNPVAVDESFNLYLQLDGGANGSEPDLHGLTQDFDVLGQSKSSSIQITNGKSTQSAQWQVSLAPKHSGQVVIPAINAGGQSSQPITLTVTAPNQAGAAQQNEDIFLDVSAEPRTAYVQQQIVFTVRLYRTLDIGNGSTLNDPTFPDMDAVVQRLGDDNEFQTVRNGKAYAVLERRYAIYPQKTGSFNSTPVVFDGNVIEGNQGGMFSFDPFNQRARRVRLRSKTVAFSIKPVPSTFHGGQWLPTSKLSVSEQWSENPPKFTVGEPVTRTITLRGNGVTASQLPAVDSNAGDGIKLYPDQPALNDSKDASGVTGTRQQKFAIIPTRAGNLTLPAIDITWWNTSTDKEEQTHLPARTVVVAPAAPGSSTSQPVPATQSNEETSTALAEPAGSPLLTHIAMSSSAAGKWPWISLVLALGWAATLLLWWLQRRRKPSPAANDVDKRQASLAAIERSLKKSCLANDATQTQSLLLSWARQRWPDNPPNSLIALARSCEPELAESLRELERILYADGGSVWNGQTLWERFSRNKPADKPSSKDEVFLEPLYKS